MGNIEFWKIGKYSNVSLAISISAVMLNSAWEDKTTAQDKITPYIIIGTFLINAEFV